MPAEDREISVKLPGREPMTIRVSYNENGWGWEPFAFVKDEQTGAETRVMNLGSIRESDPFSCFGEAVRRLTHADATGELDDKSPFSLP